MIPKNLEVYINKKLAGKPVINYKKCVKCGKCSKVIKLPIPKNGETINLNKEVVIEYNRDYGFNNENNSFKILNCQFKSDKLLMNH